MTLPAQVTDTYVWPRHRQAFLGPYQGASSYDDAPYHVTNMAMVSTILGFSPGFEYAAQSFQSTVETTLWQMIFPASTDGTPTDDLLIEIRADNAGDPAATALASETVPAASLSNYALVTVTFSGGVVLMANTTYWIVVSRTGAAGHPYYLLLAKSTTDYAAGLFKTRDYGSGTWVTDITSDLAAYLLSGEPITPIYTILADETASRLVIQRSIDGGHTWAARDVGAQYAPVYTTTNTHRTFTSHRESDAANISTISIGSGVTDFRASQVDPDLGVWIDFVGGFGPATTFNAGISGTVVLESAVRNSDSDLICVYQGTAETVMGTSRRRIQMIRFDASTFVWQAAQYVATGTTTPSGVANHEDLRVVVQGTSGRVHIFWTVSDSTQIKQRMFKSDNTWGTVIGFGAITNTTAYPLGLACTYADGATTKWALPYVDGTTTKLARCDSALSDNAANVTTETIVAVASDQATAGPGVVFADGSASKKLWFWGVTSDAGRDIFYTNDNGAGTWAAQIMWKEGAAVICDGISANRLPDGIGVVYLDSSVAPARVRYDKLLVFSPKVSTSVGSASSTIDLGETPPAEVEIIIDLGDNADPAGSVTITVDGGWDEDALNSICTDGPNAVQALNSMTVNSPPRYLRVTSLVETAASVVGVSGI